MLAKIMSEQRGIPENKAEEIVKSMRSANQYQVCSYHMQERDLWPVLAVVEKLRANILTNT